MSNPSNRNRLFIPKPPDKGSFPLDHEGECKDIINKYLKCLKGTDLNATECRAVAKEYLECRMDRNLMAKESFENLGFKEQSKDKQVKSN